MKYWRLEPYAGFGADAHSFDGALRYANAEIAAGVRGALRVKARTLTIVDTTPANLAEERFFVGLRLADGIEPDDDEWRLWAEPIDRFVEARLLETHGSAAQVVARRRAALERSISGIHHANDRFAQ